ncbi:hypothetical protein ACFX13_034948 [Malus domestica]
MCSSWGLGGVRTKETGVTDVGELGLDLWIGSCGSRKRWSSLRLSCSMEEMMPRKHGSWSPAAAVEPEAAEALENEELVGLAVAIKVVQSESMNSHHPHQTLRKHLWDC